MMNKRILVTGGAGFIGSNFIRYILRKYPEYEVVNLDKLTYCGNMEDLRDVQNDPRYSFIKGDIEDAAAVKGAMKDCDAVVNFAAESHVDRSINNPDRFIKTNVHGTLTLLKTAKNNEISRFLQISTDEVYGSIEKGNFSEESVLNSRSPYSASKAGGDLLALSFYATHKLPVLITRSSNNFGPYQYPEKIIPLFITNALEGKKLPIYADGMNVRDWLYVLDNCAAIDIVLHKGEIGEIYNVGGDCEITNIELTRKILKYMGKSEELIQFVKDRPGHDKRYSLDSSKLKALGWKPRHDFETALRKTINWYKENRQWWEPLKKKE
ncbi:MAG: dTDP-glucose 4,6-dehydratase [Candidatus Omnitrophota bacterium]|nr:dTDP-glucose 4,6-dehydratase [Candidatus Omnitrophota bacterium]